MAKQKAIKNFHEFYTNYLIGVVIPRAYNDELDTVKFDIILNKTSYPSE